MAICDTLMDHDRPQKHVMQLLTALWTIHRCVGEPDPTCGTMPLRFCFIIPDMRSGLVSICSCADFCSDF